ncbi:uncharacterized protein LOC116307299 isoform X2 [Actinia tenebrosa]|uniref:Uncharacterized protein LOC116307299 isoform X2 n=1 Tax=Actinia tenebrosa TaxID=6105 RepID=A0A6P8J1H5_ACTTE|nr:uncharacterized protein LOC116307299 isoform X2 [Actinia tenebrosa]
MGIIPSTGEITFSLICIRANGLMFAWTHENIRLFDIVFKPNKSSVVQPIPVLDPMNEFTACFWVRLDPLPWPVGSVVFLNYSAHEKHDEIVLEYQTTVQFTVGANTILRSNSFPNMDDGKRKFICVQWENKDGMTSLYINGNLVVNVANKQKDYKVLNSGDVRLELGYSSAAQDLSGRMTCVNIWDDLLSTQTILRLYRAHDCGYHPNNLVIDWQKISTKLRDMGSPLLVTPSELRNDQVIITTTCTKPQLLHGQIFPEAVLVGQVISITEVVSELQCQDQCLRAQACNAFNIEQQGTTIKKTCQLISGVTGVKGNHVSYGRVFDRQGMIKALLTPSCSENRENSP